MPLQKPNIILIDSDQQRADTVGAAGCDWMITPALDRLAADGVLFTNAFCSAATCVSSRSALYSGLYPHTTGQYGFGRFLGRLMWTHRLNVAGYRCFSVGKTHMSCGDHGYQRRIGEWDNKHLCYWGDGGGKLPCQWLVELQEAGLEPPWDRHETEPGHYDGLGAYAWPLAEEWHPDAWVGGKALDWLASGEVPTEEPFFLHVGFMGPHDPYDPPEEYLRLYEDREVPLPELTEEELAQVPPELRLSVEKMEGLHNLVALKESRVTPERLARQRRHYYANITLIDRRIGEIVDLLERRGLRENTVILFTSDHGDNLYDHGLFYKGEFYDTVVNVPLIVSGPRVSGGGRRAGDMVSHVDLAQYILDLAGAEREDLEGFSLRGTVEEGAAHERRYAFAEEGRTNHRPEPPVITMIRDERHKLVHFGPGRRGQLFDLREDPREKRNLWDEASRKEIRCELTEELFGWLSDSQYRNRDKLRKLI